MNTHRKGDWFLTSTGVQFYPLDPRPEEVNIIDIAHALSNICRFGGHCDPFYSVAQHSVHVSLLVPRPLALVGLMHDAREAYVGDMVRPLKYNIPQFMEAEEVVAGAVATKFDLPLIMPPEVKRADNIALMTEKRDVVILTGADWDKWTTEKPDPNLLIPLGPGEAKDLFLARFAELTTGEVARL